MSVKFASQNENIVIEEVEEEKDEISKEDENRFMSLCNNIINCVVLIENSQSELLEFKSILLKENIAPSILVKLSLINGKMFRSISDLHNPLGELIRLVHVYSESWEKKSQGLRKLHKDYEKKAGQLNIALKKLALQNEEAKRVARIETLQNWEQLFTKAQLSRSHGKRWKYRMFDFKMKADQGIDNLQEYFQQLLDEDDGVREKVKQVPRELSNLEFRNKSQLNESSRSNFEDISMKNLEDGKSEDEEYQESIEEKEEVESVEPISSVDVSVGTSDLNFSQNLIMRIYNTKGFEMYDNLACSVSYGDKVYQTCNIDKSQEAQEEESRIEKENMEILQANFSEPVKTKGGLIGRRKNKQLKMAEKSVEQIRKEQAEKRLRFLSRNEEIKIPIPNDVTSGINKDISYQSIKVVVFVNDKTMKKIAQSTIDIEEIKDLDLLIFKEFVYRGDMVTPPPTSSLDYKPFPNLEPMTFPLYEYQDKINSEDSPIQMGQIPIACFFSRKEDQILFNRSTEMQPINRLVEELTGINLDIISKEDLTREKIDEYSSPRPLTPLPASVLKSEFDSLVIQYKEDIESIRESYEMKIRELLEMRVKSPDKEVVRPTSVYHKDCAVSPIFQYRSVPGKKRHEKLDNRETTQNAEKPYSSKSRDTLSTSGPDDHEEVIYSNYDHDPDENDDKPQPNLKLNLPQNFLERVSYFSEISNKHRADLTSKVKSEIAKVIEERLAELYRLHDELTEEDVTIALADMCLPAMFMPVSNSTGTIYNPRAHQYFHPIGLKNLRISQAPSIFKLPPIKNNQLSVLNLFEIGNQMDIRRFNNFPTNDNVIKRIIKTSSTNIIQPESSRIVSGDN